MTTPQWTVDGSDLRYGDFILTDWDDKRDGTAHLQPGLLAALVADVAAARLVDDMAAVVRMQASGHHLRTYPGRDSWYSGPTLVRAATPGEVAALHHARQQEETPPPGHCSDCRGPQRCDCGPNGENLYARQQEHCTHPNRAFTIGGPEDSDGYVWCPDCRTNLSAEAEDDARQQEET